MKSKVKQTIEDYKMFEKGDRVLVGVSGGADSVSLLRVLQELQADYQIELTALHVEHGIRAEESLRDAAFTKKMCADLGIPCKVVSINVTEIAKERHESLEECARNCRYEAFFQEAEAWSANKIAVAHHLEDLSETILFNLCRGSGLKGISGIPAVRGKIIRPMLFVEKEEIFRYLQKLNQEFVDDSTNFEVEYTRNKVRHEVLPYLKENLNARAVYHIAEAGIAAKKAESYLQLQAELAMEKYADFSRENQCLLREKILEEHIALQEEMIYQALVRIAGKEKDIASIHVQSIRALFAKQVSKHIDLPYNVEALREYEGICLRKKENLQGKGGQWEDHSCQEENPQKEEHPIIPGEAVKISGRVLQAKLLENIEKNYEIPQKLYTKCFDYDKIVGSLLLRTRRPGDYLVVNEQGGRKKLKEYMIEQKIPREQRDQTLLIADGAHILWVIGYRISEEYKISDSTQNIIEICVENMDSTTQI